MRERTTTLKIFCNLRILEVVHFVHHANSGVNDREGAESACAFAEPET